MSISYEPLKSQSLAKQIADMIREAILVGHLKVDERLPTEEELAVRFEVSRPTIREALKRLAAQKSGTFPPRPDGWHVHQAPFARRSQNGARDLGHDDGDLGGV